MRFKQVGNRADTCTIVVKNNSTTVTIPLGAPVFYQFNGTDDGLAVINCNAAGAAQANCLCGVVVEPGLGSTTGLPPQSIGEAQVYGFCQSVRLVRQTRATTTDSYSSSPAVSLGDILQVSSLTNLDAFSDVGAGSTGTRFPYAVAAQTLSALVSQLSAGYTGASSSQTAVTTTIKAFLTIL